QTTLTPLEATLLALGIYEDTGSLVYGTTTARDLIAAAWLLERGANLDIVRDFLEHPLSDDQIDLYNRLLEGSQTYEVGGYVVLIATAQIKRNVEEIATLAHKIREAYDASAIILLVGMKDTVQLVARSTVEDIDVGQIAAAFGGGGHGRAAAAQIHDRSLEQVQGQLVDMLPNIVHPSVRVSDLMSWGVQTIKPDDTVEDAGARMQRFGHEGYPVVSKGKVIGLLTRRAVDRAMSHGLAKKPVKQVMDSGAITVRRDDSMETVQQVMMQSGWGQVPVVDGEGKLLGIVTRTDLIKRWGQHQTSDTHSNHIQQQMRDTLPVGLLTLLEAIGKEAQAQNVGLYAVGGFVRDLLLGKANMDIDLVVEGDKDAIGLGRALRDRYGGKLEEHQSFRTAKWLLDESVAQKLLPHPPAPSPQAERGSPGAPVPPRYEVERGIGGEANLSVWPPFIDFVTARREFYEEPAALPIVEQGSIKLDLHRRDFTINTLAIRLSPAPFKLLDFWGGERDLQRKIIRVIHSLSFVDDATRMLRAARFEQRLDFQIEPNTEALFADALPYIQRVSGDRLRHEIDLILQEAEPEKALRRLHSLGVLQAIYPDLTFDEWLALAFMAARWEFALTAQAFYPTADLPTVYWIILVCRLTNIEALAQRLQLSQAMTRQMFQGHAVYQALPDLDHLLKPSEVADRLDNLSDNVLLAAWAIASTVIARDQITQYAREWRHVHPTITGKDLLALGLRPGPIIGTLLTRLRRAWLDGQITTPAQERPTLQQWIAAESRGTTHDGN
ncbi:MAG: CBS domain-containing protein, partial [Anaerolineae bacterium]|nr:CBS domain-containing protein [Anaerolineae bacterium]